MALAACAGSPRAAPRPAPAAARRPGVLVVGAEQWPACVNPVTHCANSSWQQWLVPIHVLPRLMELDAQNRFVPSPLLAGAPTVSAGPPMRVTYRLDPNARWEPDGTPITSADVKFSLEVPLDTKDSLSTGGYSELSSVATPDPHTAVLTFRTPDADWPDVGGGFSGVILEKAKFESSDVAGTMQTSIGFSGGPWMLSAFDQHHEVLVANTRYWDAARVPKIHEIDFVPAGSSANEASLLASGAVDVVYPQPDKSTYRRIASVPNVDHVFGSTPQFESIWFNEKPDKPFADPNLREAFSYAFDRTRFLHDIVKPFDPNVEPLNCAAWVPAVGGWCANTDWSDIRPDPVKVAAAMRRSGYAKDGRGMWGKDGRELTLHWMENSGNARRENAQKEFIPLLEQQGFDVVTDNSPAATMFERRIPQGDYDFSMFVQVTSADPSVTSILASGSIPGPAGNGQNDFWYSNPQADALMKQSDAELDPGTRADEIHRLDRILRADYVDLPLYAFPSFAAWRTDRVGGPVATDIDSPESIFWNLYAWRLRS